MGYPSLQVLKSRLNEHQSRNIDRIMDRCNITY